ncbi:MAG TPA: 50S ribosomal protein L23 [Candidatus Paceibacterota bacterium]|nr:50S ribosomal protein L23 [Candidatus Paceibacterota bacterium]
MALFSTTPKKTTKAKTAKSAVSTPKAKALAKADGRLSTVLKAPHFSEKALISSARGVYVFQIPADANKYEIAAAIEKFYNVTPVKIRVANLPAKTVSLRTRRGVGTKARRHKAYVYLKKGDTLNLV